MKNKILSIALYFLCASFMFWLMMVHIDLTNQDIGRHIENGRQVIEKGLFNNPVLHTNTYSYVYPDYPVYNHHWLSGVFFFLISFFSSFAVLQIIYILFNTSALAIIWYLSQKKFGLWPTLISVVFTIPLLVYRTEVRPEAVSVLFFWITILLWQLVVDKKVSAKWLWLSPFIILVWVNSHIYFFLGLGVITAYIIQGLFTKDNLLKLKKTLPILGASIIAACINPGGIGGFLYPSQIFRQYGYLVTENMSVKFMWELGSFLPVYTIFAWIVGIVLFGLLLNLIFRKRFSVSWWILSLGSAAMGLMAIRNLAFFGFAAILMLSWILSESYGLFKSITKHRFVYAGIFFVVLSVSLGLGSTIHLEKALINQLIPNAGVGAYPENLRAIKFLRENIKGPIFNNYDVGSFLVYTYFPDEQVFVENRPEAYPVEFYTQEYVPMQQNESLWREEDQKWNFNAIIFNYHDQTPWGQAFLLKRINDPVWVPVYVDEFIAVWIKNTPANHDVIRKYNIPKSFFSGG